MTIKFIGSFAPWAGAMSVGDLVVTSTDEYWDNVETLLHFDNTFYDEKQAATFTPAGGAVFSASSKFGTHAGDLTVGSATHTDDSIWRIGLGGESFTTEMWINPNDLTGYKLPLVKQGQQLTNSAVNNVPGWGNSDGNMWYFGINDDALIFHYCDGTFPQVSADSGASGILAGQYSHIAAVNNSSDNTFRLYLNGVSVYQTTALTIYNVTTAEFNRVGFIGDSIDCLVDDARVTKGVARYSGASFTVPTEAFPSSGPVVPTYDALTMESGDTLTMESGVELALED